MAIGRTYSGGGRPASFQEEKCHCPSRTLAMRCIVFCMPTERRAP
ncbi:hypothetical protein I314_05516 [Cryptococcus bacillisporus CA1873]|uniref:Uncharacterized protein n=1 Tax=Cryptococcus bacillisporus CA1873 TaxID=1296111 RepID=A0ABR5B505_CRYGA|nr:hypothetical protein I314_05516 [Cryptococcus bacillisporus CA1873]|eukprot:KIR58677.1 hypothetical protein I314_05516 [Cryptococcus gattii CA1873]